MKKETRNQYLLIATIVILLFIVLIFSIFFVIRNKKDQKNIVNIKINQIYSSDYILDTLGSFYIGMYEDKNISVLIDSKGQEINKYLEEIYYDGIYPLKDGSYLIYSNYDNILNIYNFNGTNINLIYSIKDVINAKPIIYKNSYQEYIVGFVSMFEDNTYIYNIKNGNIVPLLNNLFIADYIKEDKYYVNSDLYLIIKNKEGLMGVVNYDGQTIIDYKYKNIINTFNNSFVVQDDNNNYGIISPTNEELLKINYKVIDIYDNYFLVVNNKNKIAIYDKKYEKIIDFIMNYDSLIDFDLRNKVNSIKLYETGSKIFVVNNYMEDVNKTEYERHNLYIISNNKIVKTIKQIGFNINEYIYFYDENYNIELYDKNLNLLLEFKLDNVKKINSINYVSDSIFKVEYLDESENMQTIYYTLNGDITNFNLGDLVIQSNDYLGYLKRSDNEYKLSIVDNNGNLLDSITGTNIIVNGNYIIVDHCIYEIIKIESSN